MNRHEEIINFVKELLGSFTDKSWEILRNWMKNYYFAEFVDLNEKTKEQIDTFLTKQNIAMILVANYRLLYDFFDSCNIRAGVDYRLGNFIGNINSNLQTHDTNRFECEKKLFIKCVTLLNNN